MTNMAGVNVKNMAEVDVANMAGVDVANMAGAASMAGLVWKTWLG